LPLGGAALVAAEQKRAYELIARRTKAKQCCIPPTSAEPDGGSAADDDDDAVQAFTRDGASATLLPFWWDGTSARALHEEASAAPWHLDPKSPDAWRLAGHLLDQILSLPARTDVEGVPVGGASSAWESWKKRFARFAEDSGLGGRMVPLPLQRDRDGHKGWLRIGRRRRRVLYTRTLGLFMPSEKREEQQR